MYRLDWLARLGRGEMVVVSLRPDTEDTHEFVPFDHAQVLRVLAQIAADFHALARDTSGSETTRLEESVDPRTRHRLRLAMPEEPPRGRTAKEQRDAAMGERHFARAKEGSLWSERLHRVLLPFATYKGWSKRRPDSVRMQGGQQ